jgi:hypothetical protein
VAEVQEPVLPLHHFMLVYREDLVEVPVMEVLLDLEILHQYLHHKEIMVELVLLIVHHMVLVVVAEVLVEPVQLHQLPVVMVETEQYLLFPDLQ